MFGLGMVDTLCTVLACVWLVCFVAFVWVGARWCCYATRCRTTPRKIISGEAQKPKKSGNLR